MIETDGHHERDKIGSKIHTVAPSYLIKFHEVWQVPGFYELVEVAHWLFYIK